ncbi:MAG: hypothetical protein V3S22_04020 [Candidatus Neomarinimicrobiota bacterium]
MLRAQGPDSRQGSAHRSSITQKIIKFKTKEIDIVFVFNKTDTIKQKKIELLFEEGSHFLQVYRDGKMLQEKSLLIDAHRTIEFKL